MKPSYIIFGAIAIGVVTAGIIMTVVHHQRQDVFLAKLRALKANDILRIEITTGSWKRIVTERDAIKAFADAISMTEPWTNGHNPLVERDFMVKVIFTAQQALTLEVLIDQYSPGVALVFYYHDVYGKWMSAPLLAWIGEEASIER
jgi:hypothetical protein